jgi:hypothetical protein
MSPALAGVLRCEALLAPGVSRPRPLPADCRGGKGDTGKPDESGPTDRLSRHPCGTLAIVATYGLLYALGWLAIYVFVSIPRGRLQP